LGGVITSAQEEIHFDVFRFTSLQEMHGRSDLIVEAYVESVFPTMQMPTGRLLFTDALLRSTRVLKGADLPSEFVVAQAGGELAGRKQSTGQYQLMRPGDRYIVFLRRPSRSSADVLPTRGNLTRYEIVGTYLGLFLIDELDTIRVSKDLPFYDAYDRRGKTAIVTEIEALRR
jgi:hypothetical protein